MDNICGICLQPGELLKTDDVSLPTCMKCSENATAMIPDVQLSEPVSSADSITQPEQVQEFTIENGFTEVITNDSTFLDGEDGSDYQEAQCPICSKKFTRRASYMNHVRNHSAERKHVCQYCFKAFTQAANLRNHERIHTNERPFECTQCGKAFTQITNLNNHIRLHTGERPYACTVPGCDKAFAQVTNLNNHTKTHHVNKHYKCGVCDKAFSHISQLNQHSIVHQQSDMRNFACPHCPKCFLQPAHLNSHMKVHTKPFACDFCDMKFRFSQEASLRKHIALHLEAKLFSCLINDCGKTFVTKSLWSKHMLIEHKTENDKTDKRTIGCYFESCTEKFHTSNGLNAHLSEVHGLSIVHKNKAKNKLKKNDDNVEVISISEEEDEDMHNIKIEDVRSVFQCNHCTKIFKKKKDLEAHVFKSKSCKTASLALDMVVEDESIESDEVETQAQENEDKEGMNAMVKVVCTLCFNNFIDQRTLNRHLFTKHGIRV